MKECIELLKEKNLIDDIFKKVKRIPKYYNYFIIIVIVSQNIKHSEKN